MNIAIIKGSKFNSPMEYFCFACHQLRLSFTDSKTCGNCRSGDLVIGEVGTLDKDKLIATRINPTQTD